MKPRRMDVWRRLGFVGALVALCVAPARASTPPFLAFRSSVTDLQCLTTSLCVGIDARDGNLVTTRSPRAGQAGWVRRPIAGADRLVLLACHTARWCLAVDHADRIFSSSDPARGVAGWRPARGGAARVLNNVSSLSCPSTHLCVGVAGHYVITSQHPERGGTAWHQALVNPDNPAEEIDCPTTTRCVIAGQNGLSTTTTPLTTRRWTQMTTAPLAPANGAAHLSCASADQCVVTLAPSTVLSTTNLTAAKPIWDRARLGPSRFRSHAPLRINTISCSSGNVCAAASVDGSVWASPAPQANRERHWRRVAVDGPVGPSLDPVLDVSCVTGQLCVAVDLAGHALSANAITRPTAWRRQTIDRPTT